ncbi:MAG: glycosyltransferase [Nitrosomonadales bacterium]|nr:glycosyltransferase [Nitrosomonadales bacterium]
MRILNVNDMLDLKTGGGTAERTFQMSRFLARQGASCEVLTIDSPHLDAQRIEALKPAKASVLPCLLRRFKVPRWRPATIRRAVEGADIVHLMGHWSVLNAAVYLAARRAGKPYVVCPAGALPLFGRSRWLKRVYNLFIGAAIVRNASGWIAVTAGEFPQFEEYGVSRSRVSVIPNGVSAEDFPDVDVAEFRRRNGLPDAPIILFMGRLNPIKGPDLLLQAFLHARKAFPHHHLVFAGPDGGMLASLRETAAHSGAGGMVHFIGYVGGADKSAAYRMADLLVVPSRQEAMSIVAIEAGICGVPVLLTDQCGFGEIRAIDERLEVPATVQGIAEGLSRLLAEPGVLERLSPAWSGFVERKYSWTALAPEYLKLYQRILAGAA